MGTDDTYIAHIGTVAARQTTLDKLCDAVVHMRDRVPIRILRRVQDLQFRLNPGTRTRTVDLTPVGLCHCTKVIQNQVRL